MEDETNKPQAPSSSASSTNSLSPPGRRLSASPSGRRLSASPLGRRLSALRARYPTQVQFVLFCLVGGSGVVVDYAVLIPLTELAHLDPRLAAVGAFVAAVTWNYFLNRRITFQAGEEVKLTTSYSAFVAVCLVGLGVRIGVMHALMEWLGLGEGRWYLLASFFGIVAATLTNFVGSKYFAFRDEPTESDPS